MTASAKIRSTRRLLLASVLVGIALVSYGLFIGVGLAGLIAGVAGLILGIAAVIWLAVILVRRRRAGFRPDSWRPGDEAPTR